MGRRSVFRESFMGTVRSRVPMSVKPVTIAVNSYEIPHGKLGKYLHNAMKNGYAGTSPRVVKTLDGEYLVYADGTAQFVPLGRAAGPRIPF